LGQSKPLLGKGRLSCSLDHRRRILWTVIGLGDAALWGAGLLHALIGLLFVYALAIARR
jgi:hypothetical protein